MTRGPGTLSVVATPIGHLDDASARCLAALREADAIAAEDTRVTARLLARNGIHTPLVSFHAHSPPARTGEIVERLAAGEDVALVTDAGTPGLSDPGARLVAAAQERGVPVVAVPGPSAVTAAISVAGLPGDRFLFLGFLPRKGKERAGVLRAAADAPWTVVLFEAPHRLRATLADLLRELGDREVAVARELTKVHEEVWRGTLAGAVAEWTDREPRGEFTLVVAGAPPDEPAPWTDDEVLSAMAAATEGGLGARQASKDVARASGRRAREIYALWHERAS